MPPDVAPFARRLRNRVRKQVRAAAWLLVFGTVCGPVAAQVQVRPALNIGEQRVLLDKKPVVPVAPKKDEAKVEVAKAVAAKPVVATPALSPAKPKEVAIQDAASVRLRQVWKEPATVAAAAAAAPANAAEHEALREALREAAREAAPGGQLPQQRVQRLSQVLKLHGFVGDTKADARLGLPKAFLADRERVTPLLNDLRTFNPPPGGYTTMQRRLPESQDAETVSALNALSAKQALDSVTAITGLADGAIRRQRELRCKQDSTALDAQEANVRVIGSSQAPEAYQGSAPFWKAVEAGNPGAAQRYRQAAEAYAAACLDSKLQVLTEPQARAMQAVLGYLKVDGEAECMGARVAVDRFLTARHCLYRYDRNIGWERRTVQRLEVQLAGRADRSFDTEELACDHATADAACQPVDTRNPVSSDYLVLRLKPRVAGEALPPMPALRYELAAAQQMLVVPGRSAWIAGRALRPTDPVFTTTADIGGCMISALKDGCLVNSCQSEQGFSGAPMFARRRVDELVLVGIFLGSTSETAYRQCQTPNRNFGAKLPSAVTVSLR